MTDGANSADRCWAIDTGSGSHSLVQIEDVGAAGVGRSFACDGRRYPLGGWVFLRPHVTNFEVGGRPAVMTMRLVKPGFWINLRRALRPLLNPATWIAGVPEAGRYRDAAAPGPLSWAIYELSVDGASQGSWIVRTVYDNGEWRFSAPGGWVPDRNSEAWPP